jgi:hypothetical protein
MSTAIALCALVPLVLVVLVAVMVTVYRDDDSGWRR